MAAYIKKEFDSKHTPTWHCIVGRNFGAAQQCGSAAALRQTEYRRVQITKHPMNMHAGSYVTHETKHFVYFYLGPVAVLLFKSG